MGDDNQKHIRDVQSNLLRTIRIWSIGIFVLLLAIIVFIDMFPLVNEIKAKGYHNMYKLVFSIKGLVLNILPLLIVAIFIEPITRTLRMLELLVTEDNRVAILKRALNPIQNKLDDVETKTQTKLGDVETEIRTKISDVETKIQTKLEDVETKVKKINKFQEIIHFSCQYLDTPWESILKKAKKVELSVFFTSSEWNDKFRSAFKKFLVSGGALELFLPKENEISSAYMGDSKIPKDIEFKIRRTKFFFRKIESEITSPNLNIRIVQQGLHYMFSRIIMKDGAKNFIFSPYLNSKERVGSPVLIVNENTCDDHMIDFIDSELKFIKENSRDINHFNNEKYVIWKKCRRRVFISSGLRCPARCSFCYVDSLLFEEDEKQVSVDEADIKSLCSSVVTSPHFEDGEKGTAIMLGAFNDPFHNHHFKASMKIIDYFSEYKNYVHIAARHTIGENRKSLFLKNQNVVINFSLSTLKRNIELNNQIERFKEAKELIKEGYKVALFLRPILHNHTKNEIDKIIELALDANIRVVTIGGLYIDNNIRTRLTKIINFENKLDFHSKSFILDDKNILKKLKIDDIEIIQRKFRDSGIEAFLSSDERISYYQKHL